MAFALVVGVSYSGLVTAALARAWPQPSPINQDFAGLARVVDGDTINVGDTRVRLEGIDAPESAQMCKRANGSDWRCGTEATRAMRAMVEDRVVTCRNHGTDIYGRTIATCFVGGVDVDRQMVVLGLAWAYVKYSRVYVAEEAVARVGRVGIWQGAATPAWEWRAQVWKAKAEVAPTGCAIKGNVNTEGSHIYHMPWSPWYDKVKIDGHPEKRWFCSEAEAQAAGWRPAFTPRAPSEPLSEATAPRE